MNVLGFDFLEKGLTPWISSKVQHITMAINPDHIYESTQLAQKLKCGSKIYYFGISDKIDKLEYEIGTYKYDFIISFSFYSDSFIKQIMRKFAPYGECLAFHQKHHSMKYFYWTENSDSQREIHVDILLHPGEFKLDF